MGHIIPIIIIIIIKPKFANSVKSNIEEKKKGKKKLTHTHTHTYKISTPQVFCEIKFELNFRN
jgi:hypothetical protein